MPLTLNNSSALLVGILIVGVVEESLIGDRGKGMILLEDGEKGRENAKDAIRNIYVHVGNTEQVCRCGLDDVGLYT